MDRVYLYPLWLRFWHWTNATLYAILIISGFSMHYAALIPFATARVIHNTAGILLVFMYLDFLIGNLFSWNGKQYIVRLNGLFTRLFKQARFYLYGIFKGEPHPYETTAEAKFNPLQQVTYVTLMFVIMPLIIISGLLILFPEYIPQLFIQYGGIAPIVLVHFIIGVFLTLFMIGHMYLGTTGETLTSNFKSMADGYHVIHVHASKEEEGENGSPEK